MDTTTPLGRAIKIAGTPTALAELIGTKQSTVWDWLNVPGRKMSPQSAVKVEQALDGQVTAAELRPDLAALFGPAPKARKRRAA